MPQSNILELAKQGNPKAIAVLITQCLKPVQITAKATIKENQLHILLEADKPLKPEKNVALITKLLEKLEIRNVEAIESVVLHGKNKSGVSSTWSRGLDILKQVDATDRVNLDLRENKDSSGDELNIVESEKAPVLENIEKEVVHVFVNTDIARKGGIQKISLRTGKTHEINIPVNTIDGTVLVPKEHSLNCQIIVHTLFDKETSLDSLESEVQREINLARVEQATRNRCRRAFIKSKSAEAITDTAALALVDFLIEHSEMPKASIQKYTVASQNSRLLAIEDCIESSLKNSQLSENEKELIRGTYQYVRAGEVVPDLTILTQLDSIVQGSTLLAELKQVYFSASAMVRASAVDSVTLNLINTSSDIENKDRSSYLSIYAQVRNGDEIQNKSDLELLDTLIANSGIPDEYKAIYQLASERFFETKSDHEDSEFDLIKLYKKVKGSAKKAAAIVPTANNAAAFLGVKAGTGAAIGTLSGGAATNATLAALGGGSVAAGGLGMLGGLAIATGGAALIGAAALVSIASMSQMDAEDKLNLGIAAGAGIVTSAAAVGAAWTAVSTFGIASTGTAISTLSGAAAYSSIMAALGGVTAITGGTALIALGAGFAAWKYLGNQKENPQRFIRLLEAKLYTLHDKSDEPLLLLIEKYLQGKENIFIAPEIPLDKISSALSKFISIREHETILSLIDTTLFGSAKEGIVLTDQRVVWRELWSDPISLEYTNLCKNVRFPELYDEEGKRNLQKLLKEIGELKRGQEK